MHPKRGIPTPPGSGQSAHGWPESGRGGWQFVSPIGTPSSEASARHEAEQGDLLVSQGRIAEALCRFSEAARLQPNSPEYHFKVACAASDAWEHTLVEPHFLRAVSLAPKHVRTRKLLAQWYSFQGQTAGFLEQSAAALALSPGDPELIVLRAYALVAGDRADEGLELLEPLLAAGPVTAPVARCYGAIAEKLRLEPQAVEMIGRALSAPTLTGKQRSRLHFTAVSLLDRTGRYDEAFAHAKAANELSRQEYDPAKNSGIWSAYIEYFSKERLQSLAKATHGSQRPVFIVGMPRSGTSLVEQILACHQAIFGAGELSRLSEITCPAAIAPWSQGRPYPYCFDVMSSGIADQLAANYLSLIEKINGSARYVTDKQPQNFTYLGHAELLFPGCKVIHCIRDARDTCLSNYLTDFMIGLKFSHDLSHIAAYYRDYVRMMDHWKRVSSLPILDVRYEDLVANQAGETRRILQFLDLPWDPACLFFYKNNRPVSTASRAQVRTPIYSSSIGRWKNYQVHIPELLSLMSP
jgi:tetratricopeptide (TPR) repeat protein